MGTHKPSTALSVNTLARTLFHLAAHTLQRAHLQSRRIAPIHTLVSQHTINTLVRSRFIHAWHTWMVAPAISVPLQNKLQEAELLQLCSE